MPRVAGLVLTLLASACGSITDGESRRQSVSIAFARDSAVQHVAALPFVSVVDSVAVAVVPSTGPVLRKGAHLSGRDFTSPLLEFAVPVGRATFQVTVLSTRRVVLYSGSRDYTVDGNGFSLDVPITAQSPVLVIHPDTVSVTVPAVGLAQTVLTVYNRGVGTMTVSVQDTFFVSRSQCAKVRCYRIATPLAQVPGNSALAISVDSIRRFQTPIPVTFSTAQGDAQVVFRTP